MMMRGLKRAALPLAVIGAAAPAQAADVAFSGSVMNAVSNVGDPSVCASGFFHTYVLPTAGTSPTLGGFTYSSDVCQAVGQPITGTFNIVLADGSFAGTQVGLATPVPGQIGRPTLFDLVSNYTITGGTGAYTGATGSFVGTGTVDQRSGATLISLNFRAVPEPASWAMMLVGFAGIGMTMRRSQRRRVMPQLA
ncbi:PEPxxWA-CTERM sorting domain-containing protein [Sphingomonas flavescens]|jgi:hypothetical protein|uniref:PEPxxWA-CTERM sorting domain-containing protein n=1 Tax=Sphingomonas flavescens TaxID=3132797 RepID=UPI002805052C|nr:PEPxxWA-CTERM sorting domain-containing protein [Sphingomonas limnosediminicola]